MSIKSESHFTRLEQILHHVKEYKDQVKFWERLETEEIILLNRKVKDEDEQER